jgi:glycosyltransferase involved in cell wall biosynthesis
MVLLEALASSLPVVATDVGGSRDVVLAGRRGYLVPPREPEALAHAMLEVMALSPARRHVMREAVRDRVSRESDLESVAGTWEALYLEQLRILGERAGGKPTRRRGST